MTCNATHKPAKQLMADAARQTLRGALALLAKAGWAADAFHAGAHAEIATLTTACLGKESAASFACGG